MASNYVCSLAVAVISLLVAVAFLSSLTCDGADCFAVQNLQITRFSRLHSHLKPAKPEQVESLYSGGPVLEQSEKVSDNSSEEDGSGIVDERAEQGDLEDIEVVSGESSVDAVEKASSKPVEGIRDDIVGQFSADAVEIASSKPVDAGEEASSDTVEVIRSETVGNDAAGGYVEDDQEASASSPDPVIFGTGFYPDGRFHPQTGFDPYAPTTPPLLPARKLTLNVMDFGAVGDGITLNTAAFEAAVAAASDTVGGALLLVPNGVWLTGCFNLTSHLTLFLESGAVLLASQVGYPQHLRITLNIISGMADEML